MTVYTCNVPENEEVRKYYVLRSDGKVLVRHSWRYLLEPYRDASQWSGSKYSILGTYCDAGKAIVALVARYGQHGQVSVSVSRF